MKAESLSFRKIVEPLEEGTLKERVKSNGSVRSVKVRFYPGQEKSLQVKPFVFHKGERAEDMFTYVNGTDSFMSGDNDVFEFNVTMDIEYDDEIAVYYNNINSTYSYSLVVDIEISYHEQEVKDIG